MWTARVLIAAVLVACAAASADARRRHHDYYGYGGYGERSSGRMTLDEWRARQQQERSGEPSRGEDRSQVRSNVRGNNRGNDRGDDVTSGRGQNAQGAQAPQDPQSAGPERSLDRAQGRQDLGQGRARYDRRRYRDSDAWWRSRDSRDERRRAREEDRRRGRDNATRSPAAAPDNDPTLSRARAPTGAFGATIETLVRGCAERAAEFTNWPLDAISETVAPDDTQRNALEALRGKAKAAGERLSAECPRDVPSAPAARLDAAAQGIAATLAAFDTVEPALKGFYAALNDEQKARLYRAMAGSGAVETTGRGAAQDARAERRDTSSRRRHSRASRAASAGEDAEPRGGANPAWSGTCEALAGALRNWPVREIERGVRLTDAQRVALYELVTASLKTAETLAPACPSGAALTPVGRMEAMRASFTAVRAALAAIRPALTRFYDALDADQQQRFAGMS